MRIVDLISIGKRYFFLGLLAATAVIILLYVFNRFIAKDKNRLKTSQIILQAISACYFMIVFGATLLDRSIAFQNHAIMPFLYSYKDAWMTFSATSWRNIILNYLLFVPFGILIPLEHKRFRNIWKTTLAAFVFSLSIEMIQLITGIGIFEFDDLLGNTVGAMIGYGLFELLINLYCLKRNDNQQTKNIPRIMLFQIPLFVTIAVFAGIFVTYNSKELGNIRNQCIAPLENVSVTSAAEYSEESGMLPVYRMVKDLTKEETTQFAKAMFEKLDTKIDETRNDFYEDTAIFYAEDRYCIWIDYKGGDYKLTDFETSFSDEPTIYADGNATEDIIRNALSEYGVFIPSKAEFYRFDGGTYEFIVNMAVENGYIYNGSLSCEYYNNGKFASIKNNIVALEPYKEYETISELDAYQKICEGEFYYGNDSDVVIETEQCHIEYLTDTKGFYQPIYVFSCKINGYSNVIQIPAISN